MAGIARGKVMPAVKFAEDEGMRMPESIFPADRHGRIPGRRSRDQPVRNRHRAEGRPTTTRVVPWAAEPTAQVIHDSYYSDGRPVTMAPRYVLAPHPRHVCGEGLEADRRAGTRVLTSSSPISTPTTRSSRRSVARAGPRSAASPTASRQSTSSTRCSTTSTRSARRRKSRSTR